MSERLNTKDFLVEPQPPAPHHFDLERDITPEQWHNIAADREEYASDGKWNDFAYLANLETLHSGTPPKLNLNQWQIIAQRREVYGAQGYLSLFASLVTLESLHTGTPPKLSSEKWQEIASRHEEAYAILESLRTRTPPKFSAERWQEITTSRERAGADSSWLDFAACATLEALGSAKKITLKPGGGIALEYDTPVETDDTSPPQHRKF